MSLLAIKQRFDLLQDEADVQQLAIYLQELGGIEPYTINKRVGDLLYREMHIKKGTLVIGRIHLIDNIGLLLKGSMVIWGNSCGFVRARAPFTSASKAGTRRVGYALSDCIFANVLPVSSGLNMASNEDILNFYSVNTLAEYLSITTNQLTCNPSQEQLKFG